MSDRRAVFNRARLATLEVIDADNDVSCGSAFAVHRKHGPGVIVSAAHVLQPTDGPRPTHFRFFVVDSDPATNEWRAQSVLLGIDPSAVVVHESHDLAAIQYPNTRFPDGQTLHPGNSGGPIFDLRTGSVIGIVSKRLAQKVVGIVDDMLADGIMIMHGLTSAVPIHHFASLDFLRLRRAE